MKIKAAELAIGPGTYLAAIQGPSGSGLLNGYYSSTLPGKWSPDQANATPIVITSADKYLGRITIPRQFRPQHGGTWAPLLDRAWG